MRVLTNVIRRRAKYEIFSKTCTATAIQSSQMTTAEKRKLDESTVEQPTKRVAQLMPTCHVLWCEALDLNDTGHLIEPIDQTVLFTPKLFCGLQNSLYCDLKLLNDNHDLNLRFTTIYFLTTIFRRMLSVVGLAKDFFAIDQETHTYRDVRAKIALPENLNLSLVNPADSKTSWKDKPYKKSPNYFIAVQIKNSEIAKNLQDVQISIANNNSKLQSAFISPATIHITLMVMHLDEEHCLHDAKRALSVVVDKLKSAKFHPLKLTFEGVGNFKNEVIFAKVKNDFEFIRLSTLADIVKNSFSECDIISTDNRPFSPHLTIAKLSKDPTLWRRKVKKIEPAFYKEHLNLHFGVEEIKSIQLLSMMKRKDAYGYYHCVKEVPFNS